MCENASHRLLHAVALKQGAHGALVCPMLLISILIRSAALKRDSIPAEDPNTEGPALMGSRFLVPGGCILD